MAEKSPAVQITFLVLQIRMSFQKQYVRLPKSPEIMADAILCLKSKMAANEPEVVISSKL